MLSVLSHLNYKPWYALAEFVDNSLQSYLDYHEELAAVEGPGFTLRVSIEIDQTDEGRIIIRDNAAGIHEKDYPRAFRPAQLPPERSGLSEFGMGMKSAACWFSDRWSVRTSALGEPVEREVAFDIDRIVADELEELSVRESPANANTHFTEIILRDLHRPLHTKTLSKIKEHLASIYRIFLRRGVLELVFNGERLTYSDPPVLHAPYFRDEGGEPIVWRKTIEWDFGDGMEVHGFAALRETASTTHAGFALFRRGRLIQGSADEAYRPEYIFEKPNSFVYQRLFGELHLEGFEVSHTKDGFVWKEHEGLFLELLKEYLNQEPLPLLSQAKGYRVRPRKRDMQEGAEQAVRQTALVVETHVPQVLAPQLESQPDSQPPPPALPEVGDTIGREIVVDLNGVQWRIQLELTTDPAVSDWLTVSYWNQRAETRTGSIGVRVCLAHPFMDRFSGVDSEQIEPILRIAVAIALGEAAARASGVRYAGTIRRNINDLLRNALSKP
ncbi:MAG: ATP-binding protein [Betaproteobacteria bacterium]